jgi:hypothetical protein
MSSNQRACPTSRPALDSIPVIGFLAQVFLGRNIIVYIAIVIQSRCRSCLPHALGLRCAVGEHPEPPIPLASTCMR